MTAKIPIQLVRIVNKVSALRPRSWRIVISLLAALCLFSGVGLVSATQASAAGTATVTVCFREPSGNAYTGSTFVQYLTPQNTWAPNASASGTTSGCRTWYPAAGYVFRFFGYSPGNSSYYFYGATPMYKFTSGVQYNLGSFLVVKMF